MDIRVDCNTDDETIFANIRANSERNRNWLNVTPEHDGHAVICGSGPSLIDTLDLIRWRKGLGQTIFALNNAANILFANGITPDYQIIIDARPETISLLGPARHYLLCSQVDQQLARACENATIFHPAIDGLDDVLPDHNQDFALIGGGTTSGITALCVAYAMGYRKIHCFGYDSCHKDDQAHAKHQAINDHEPWMMCEWNGKTYKGSVTMFRQAELFQPTCDALIDMGCTITVDGYGLIPDIARQSKSAPMAERDKYEEMWRLDVYRQVSPGEHCVENFLEIAKPPPEARIIDFGCGTGRASTKLAKLGYRPVLVDFVEHSRDPEAMNLPFIHADLAKLPDALFGNYGFCSDVMEHIPTDDVETVINSIMSHCKECFFQIAMHHDHCGKLIDQELHVTIKPMEWWMERFFNLGFALRYAKRFGSDANFYVTR